MNAENLIHSQVGSHEVSPWPYGTREPYARDDRELDPFMFDKGYWAQRQQMNAGFRGGLMNMPGVLNPMWDLTSGYPHFEPNSRDTNSAKMYQGGFLPWLTSTAASNPEVLAILQQLMQENPQLLSLLQGTVGGGTTTTTGGLGGGFGLNSSAPIWDPELGLIDPSTRRPVPNRPITFNDLSHG